MCVSLRPFAGLEAFGTDAQRVADAVKKEVEQLKMPEQEKLDTIQAALSAAAVAERPDLKMNGTAGLEPNLAGGKARSRHKQIYSKRYNNI